MAIKFTEENFDSEVLKASTLAFVDFYADWCGPCKMMGPVIDELSTEYEGKVKVGKLNVDEAPAIAANYRVVSIPTMILFKNGEAVDQIMGAVPKQEIINLFNKYL